MNKRLLSDSEKLNDKRFDTVQRVSPGFDCYDDGSYEIKKEMPPGLKYIMYEKFNIEVPK